MTTTATIDQLKPGSEYPDGNIQARKLYTQEAIDELAASLKGPDGQLRPLLVATHPKAPGVHFVLGGGRRRLAFQQLIAKSELPVKHPIDIKDLGHISVEEALSKSLADNQHVAMHPADQAQTFAKLAVDKAPERIARERGMTIRAVNQSIALGSALIPEVLAKWRDGVFTRENVELLTTATDDQQRDLIAKMTDKKDPFDPQSFSDWEEFKREITAGKAAEMARLLGFVTPAAARAAGLEVLEDFFGKGGTVKDLRGLQKLAGKKMKELEKAELEAGWSWVEGKLSVSRRMHHGYGECKVKPSYNADEKARLAAIEKRSKEIGKELDNMSWHTRDDGGLEAESEKLDLEREIIEVEAANRAYTAKQKASAGVIIHLHSDGRVDYDRGLIRREEKKTKNAKSPARSSYQEREPEALSWQARRSLSAWNDAAVSTLLAQHPREAFAAFLACVGSSHINNRDPLRPDMADNATRIATSKGFDEAFAEMLKLTPDQMVASMGAVASDCVSITDHQSKLRIPTSLLKLIGEDNLAAELLKQFDAKVYFSGASRRHVLGVIKEALGEDARAAAEANKSDDAIRKQAIAEVPKTGWLPPEMRCSRYIPPKFEKTKAKVEQLKPKAKPAKSAPKKKAA